MAINKFDVIADFVGAGFPGLWVLTQEPERAQQALLAAMDAAGFDSFSFASWDCDRGMIEIGANDGDGDKATHGKESKSPGYPFSPAVYAHGAGEERRVICLHNFHRLLDHGSSAVIQLVQAFYNAIVAAEAVGTHYVVFAPALKIPAELEKAFTVFEFPLPAPAEIAETAGEILKGAGLDLPVVDPAVVEAAKGLTRRELRNVLSLSIRQEQRFDPKVVWGLKAEAVEKSGVLQLLKSNDDTFGSIAGLEGAKDLIRRLCTYRESVGEHAKGILLTGAPGCGKSALCRAAGAETGRPVLRMDIGSLMAKHVGDSEANLRAAIAVAEAISPCVLMVDEIEKSTAGMASGEGDSGVARRMFGHLLTWMEERKAPVFVMATSNDLSKLPAEFLRAGRWSCEMFVDLPTPEERVVIWLMYLGHYKLKGGVPATLDDSGWTGGEIKQTCYLAAQLDIPIVEAAKKVRITSRSRRSLIDDLRRTAAESQMLSATTGEPYVLPGIDEKAAPPIRKISGRRTNNPESN